MGYRRKIFLLLLAGGVSASGLSAYLSYQAANRALLDQIASKLQSIASTTAALADGDAQRAIATSADEESSKYKELAQFLRRARNANRREDVHVHFVNTVLEKPGTSNWVYGVDPEESFEDHNHPGDAYKPDSKPFEIGMTRSDNETETDPDGTWLNAYAPMKDRSGNVVGELEVEAEADNFWRPRRLLRLETAGGFAIASVLILVGAAFTANLVGGPVDKLVLASSGYVPRTVIDSILNGTEPVLNGERKRITVLFADIRNFTTMAETMRPEEAVSLLGEFFEIMVEVILRNQGYIDKFLGDGLMAIFGAPGEDQYQEEHAIAAALQMQKETTALAEKWKVQGRALRIGSGINSGSAIVGNIGSRKRFEFTAIGDTVNVASRLESATKTLDVDILISEDTYHPARPAFSFIKTGPIEVKGRTEPVVTYSVQAAPPQSPSSNEVRGAKPA